jgi:hypothetical protein
MFSCVHDVELTIGSMDGEVMQVHCDLNGKKAVGVEVNSQCALGTVDKLK